MFKHTDIWAAIDALAQKHGLSPSGLALKAGLSSTLFNPSKRVSAKRKRWPSTESIAAILDATDTSLADFVALAHPRENTGRTHLPLIASTELADMAKRLASLQEAPDTMPLPGSLGAKCFAVEITDKAFEPAIGEGARLIVNPDEKLRRNDTVMALLASGEVVIKLLGREGAQKVELLPLNGDAPPLTLARADILWLYRVVWVSR